MKEYYYLRVPKACKELPNLLSVLGINELSPRLFVDRGKRSVESFNELIKQLNNDNDKDKILYVHSINYLAPNLSVFNELITGVIKTNTVIKFKTGELVDVAIDSDMPSNEKDFKKIVKFFGDYLSNKENNKHINSN